MPHVSLYNTDTNIIETTLNGLVTAEEIVETMHDAARLSARHKCYKWLNDFTLARIEVTTVDIYNFPAAIVKATQLLGEDKHRVRRAIVRGSTRADFRFAENVSLNRGQQLQVFGTLDEARRWLNSDE